MKLTSAALVTPQVTRRHFLPDLAHRIFPGTSDTSASSDEPRIIKFEQPKQRDSSSEPNTSRRNS